MPKTETLTTSPTFSAHVDLHIWLCQFHITKEQARIQTEPKS